MPLRNAELSVHIGEWIPSLNVLLQTSGIGLRLVPKPSFGIWLMECIPELTGTIKESHPCIGLTAMSSQI